MAENLTKVPKRGILKASTSFEQREAEHSRTKNPHFDESNILATLHPADKDYGFMKIDEPKTPYEYASGVEDEEKEDIDINSGNGGCALDANILAERIASEGPKGPRPRRTSEPSADEEDLQLLTPEEREKRRKFEQKRKMHYNEFYAVKMARQLMDSDDDSEKESDGNDTGSSNQGAITGSTSTVENQSSTTLPESSSDANVSSVHLSNTQHNTKVNIPTDTSSNISEKSPLSSVPMDTTNSPSA